MQCFADKKPTQLQTHRKRAPYLRGTVGETTAPLIVRLLRSFLWRSFLSESFLTWYPFRPMTVSEFISKWRKVELKERSAAQEHFLDLCSVFDHPTPAAADPTGETFCFENGAAKHGGGDGFADVGSPNAKGPAHAP